MLEILIVSLFIITTNIVFFVIGINVGTRFTKKAINEVIDEEIANARKAD